MADVQGEPFHETKTRIQERLGVPEKDFAKFKFSLISSALYKQPSAIEDGEFIIALGAARGPTDMGR